MLITKSNRIFSLLKRNLQIYGNLGTVRLPPPVFIIQLWDHKSIHITSVPCNTSSSSELVQTANVKPLRLKDRLFKNLGIMDLNKYKYMALSCMVYEHVMQQIDYSFFYKYFNMPDTFFSWFLVTELHVWMLMVRFMAEGKDGQFIRNHIVQAMWDDTKSRTSNLGPINSKTKTNQIKELWHHFNAALVGYDEGIQSDDKILAGALWRRFFYLECNNPEHVETLLVYVRKHISLFDTLPRQEVLKNIACFNLIHLKNFTKHQ